MRLQRVNTLSDSHFHKDGLKVKKYANFTHERAGATVFISNSFKTKECYSRQRRTFHNDEVFNIAEIHDNLGIHTVNNRAPKHMKQKLRVVKEEMGHSSRFYYFLSILHGSSRQKTSKDTEGLNNTVKQPRSIKHSYPTTAKYALVWNTRGTFTRIDHVLNHKAGLNKL